MRRVALAVAACVFLAGCAVPFADAGNGSVGDGGDSGISEDGGDSRVSEDGGTATPPTDSEAGGTPVVHEERADPDADRLGWENGYWHDDPVPVEAADGLNASEREAVVGRAMARVEVIRHLEFERTVNVTVVSRANGSFGGGNHGQALRTFDNAKFEALFLIGTDEDSIGVQDRTRNRTVGGYYDGSREAIVIVSDSETPTLDGERTLAHELVHALQDQHFNLSADIPPTRDAYNGRNGLVEGDASAVEREYMDRCGGTWSCLPTQSEAGGGGSESSIHLGVYVISFFPYSDGPGFVNHLRDGDDWSAVNDAFADPPTSSAVIITPGKYGTFEPADVEVRDRTQNGWERVRPDGRLDYAVLGPSALTAMFAYTLYDEYNRSAVVDSRTFLNTEAGSVDMSDPFNYSLAAVRGWQGDRLHVYERDGERGYVWRLAWESPADASRFADRYRALLAHWGGQQVGDGTWVIDEDSPFAGAVSLGVDGETVTIVHAPETSALGDVHRGVE